jgi:NAD+ kinase
MIIVGFYCVQLKAQGKAPPALRWERLKSRFDAHTKCFEAVIEVLSKSSADYSVIGREEMHRGSLLGKDLVISVGGDGTLLGSASFLDDSLPMLGVNSDPSRHDAEVGGAALQPQLLDERRSKGALCAVTARDVASTLPLLLSGDIAPTMRTRIQ